MPGRLVYSEILSTQLVGVVRFHVSKGYRAHVEDRFGRLLHLSDVFHPLRADAVGQLGELRAALLTVKRWIA